MSTATAAVPMTAREAEEYLLGLELFGMRFGTERMRRLLAAMGSPQDRFGSIHVVGSNGKSSTTRMIAAILRRHGMRTGAYLSPHLVSFGERIRIDDVDLDDEAFAGAVSLARAAAEQIDAEAEPDDKVTQFEALTAAAFGELARAGVEVAVVEAGLGGRYDATNVIASRVQVLTNVSLEHTKHLGPTITAIAGEKLDVVRPGGHLIVPENLHPEARAVAERVCAERSATLVTAPPLDDPSIELAASGPFQRRNFALAYAAVEAWLGGTPDPDAVRAAALETLIPGRFQRIDSEPETIVDGAHNPEGILALTEALRDAIDGRRLVAVISILDDKDAAAMLAELLPLCAEVICTRTSNPRSLPPATLQSLSAQLGWPIAHMAADPHIALDLARELAGPDGLALATGSLYLISDLMRPRGAAPGSTL